MLLKHGVEQKEQDRSGVYMVLEELKEFLNQNFDRIQGD